MLNREDAKQIWSCLQPALVVGAKTTALRLMNGEPVQSSVGHGLITGGATFTEKAARLPATPQTAPVSQDKLAQQCAVGAVKATQAAYAARAVAAAVKEQPIADAEIKVERVAEGERITRLAGNRLSAGQRRQLAAVKGQRADAILRDTQARQLILRRQGPAAVENLRKTVQTAPKVAAKAKGPALS